MHFGQESIRVHMFQQVYYEAEVVVIIKMVLYEG